MKILVTGGAGFIGSNFVRHVLTTHPEDSVVNLDKLTYAGNLENLRDVEKDPRYRFVRGDICDGAIVREAMDGMDAVVHFAAETHVDRSNAGADEFLKTNASGTFTLSRRPGSGRSGASSPSAPTRCTAASPRARRGSSIRSTRPIRTRPPRPPPICSPAPTGPPTGCP